MKWEITPIYKGLVFEEQNACITDVFYCGSSKLANDGSIPVWVLKKPSQQQLQQNSPQTVVIYKKKKQQYAESFFIDLIDFLSPHLPIQTR